MDPKNTNHKEFSQQVSNASKQDSIVELLAMLGGSDVEFEPPLLGDELLRIP
ncbi:MAG: hypothetical protein OXU75_11385 [Deltaproteobacteria bacterium]|nr:hypothetical protein [Deltaproteobacteria bacterium]